MTTINLQTILEKEDNIQVDLTIFQENKVSLPAQWSRTCSILSEMSIDILSTLNHLKVLYYSCEKLPFILLEGCDSRFKLPFLSYITDKVHEWCSYIVVP